MLKLSQILLSLSKESCHEFIRALATDAQKPYTAL